MNSQSSQISNVKFPAHPDYFDASLCFDFVEKNKLNIFVVQGFRGDGKTWGIIREAFNRQKIVVYMRRFAEEGTKKAPGSALAWTEGKYLSQSTFKLTYKDANSKTISINIPTTVNPETGQIVCFYVNLNTAEHLASLAIFNEVTDIVFDEFTSREDKYLKNEVKILMNIIATIERNRQNVTLWLISNFNKPLNPHQDWLQMPIPTNYEKNKPFIYYNGKYKIGCYFLIPTKKKRDKLDKTLYGMMLHLSGNYDQQVLGDYQADPIPYLPVSYVENDPAYMVFVANNFLHEIIFKNGNMIVCKARKNNLTPTLALDKESAFLYKIDYYKSDIDDLIEDIYTFQAAGKFYFASYLSYEALMPFITQQKNDPEVVEY